jgi:putative DNA primase/helicase
MELHPACRYDRADVERHLLPESPSPKLRAKPVGKGVRHPKQPDRGPRADASFIVQECAWFHHCRDDAQTLPEPEWYALLSILGRCENGEALAHEWSRVYPGYTPEETAAKLTHALESAGPRTCQNIRHDLDGEQS